TSGIWAPPASRNSVNSGEFLFTVNLSWNTLGPSLWAVTSTLVRALRTSAGTGVGTPGPIISVRLMPLRSTVASREAGRQGDAQDPAHGRRQVLRAHGAVGVADPPELLRIAQVLGGDHIQALALLHHVLLHLRQLAGLRQEAAPHVRDDAAVGRGQRGRR